MSNFGKILSNRIKSLLVVFLIFGVLLPFDSAEVAQAAGAKVTICHRTRSTTNPYRLITISNAGFNGHRNNHTGGLWDNTKANGDIWGDIQPGGDTDANAFWSDGSAGPNSLNWTAAGKAFMMSGGANLSKCTRMTAKGFYDVMKAAGATDAEIATDLNDQSANDDAAVKPAGGFTAAGIAAEVATTGSATTNAATSINATTATLNGSISALSTSTTPKFEYSTASDLLSGVTTVAGGTAGTNTVTAIANVTGLTANTQYYFRAIGEFGSSDTGGTYYGSILSFTTLATADTTAPTVTLLRSAATSTSATITFTVTGNENITCSTLSTASGTDFTFTNISAITGIVQTNATTCTITATSTATAGGGTVNSSLTAAGSFSMTDTAGNAQTTLTITTLGTDNVIAVTIADTTAPTVTLAASNATSTSATITFTVTGNENITCSTLSTTSGTDFTFTNISAITGIVQTSTTVCTITATSTALPDGVAVTSTLTAAGSFRVDDTAGNGQTTLTASPKSTVVTRADTTAPTVTLLRSAATSTSATITFTVTGNENITCSTLSTASGTDFTFTNISAITGIVQTNATTCTITATSTATAGGGTVNSSLTAAGSFSMTDTAGNAQTTLTITTLGTTNVIAVTVPTTTTTTAAPATPGNSGGDGGGGGGGGTTTTTTTTTIPTTTTTIRAITTTAAPTTTTTVAPLTTTTVSTRRITICHATSSATNPYLTITVDANSLNGHGGHNGDIIPAPSGGCPSRTSANVSGSTTTTVRATTTTTIRAASTTAPSSSATTTVSTRRVTICHATSSATNPYLTLTVDANSLNGHGDHNGDIIPAPSGGCPSGSGASVSGSTTTTARATTTTTIRAASTTNIGNTPTTTVRNTPTTNRGTTNPQQITTTSINRSTTSTTVNPSVRALEISSTYVRVCHKPLSGAFISLYLPRAAANAHSEHDGDIVPAPAGGCPASGSATDNPTSSSTALPGVATTIQNSSGSTSSTLNNNSSASTSSTLNNNSSASTPSILNNSSSASTSSTPGKISEVAPQIVSTLDFGGGVVNSDKVVSGSKIVGTPLNSAVGATSNSQRTITQLAQEQFTGFAPNSGALLEIIGARTVGQFVTVPGANLDGFTIAAALNESVSRTAAEFVKIDDSKAAPAPSQTELEQVNKKESTNDEMGRMFFDSGLPTPTRLDDLQLPANSSWVSTSASVKNYAPGTVIYLAVTSDPIVISEAIVDEFGNAQVSGVFPVGVFGNGAHSLRVIGRRLIDGVAADASGEIKISDEAMNEIRKFDMQSNATIRYLGFNTSGGNTTAIRVVPLRSLLPWWTLWLIVWTIIIGLIVKLSGRTNQKRDLIIGSGLVVLSALPSQYYGWTEIAYPVMYWGEGLTLIGLILWWITPKLKRNKSVEELNFEEGVKDEQKISRMRTNTAETPTAKVIVRPVSTSQRLNSNFSIIETTTPDETT